MAADISLMLAIMARYIAVTTTQARANPPQPAPAMPEFQPEKSPEMTAATPIPHSPQKPAERVRPRLSK
jgi:hypothetical protein